MRHEHGKEFDARDQLIIQLEVGIEFAPIMNNAIDMKSQSLKRNGWPFQVLEHCFQAGSISF